MVTAESLRGRRIVGSLDRGADLMGALREACTRYKVHTAELRAIGTLEQAEVCVFDQTRRQWGAPRMLTGSLELLSLTGNISEQAGGIAIVARAVVMRERDSGMELLGGNLVGARVYSIEFVIEAFDDVLLRRSLDGGLGLASWTDVLAERAEPPAIAPAPAPTPAPAPVQSRPSPSPIPAAPKPIPTAAPTRAAAPAPARPPARVASPTPVPLPSSATPSVTPPPPVARRVQREDHDDVVLAAGDVIVHPTFRRCVVERVESDNEFVQVRLRNGRVVRLNLEILQLRPQGIEDGQRVYEAQIDD